MENQFERFFKLHDSLVGLVMSGAREPQWLCDQLQKIVDIPQPHVVFRMTIPEYRAAVQRLDKLRPLNRGEQILEAVGPFYKERPRSLSAKKALPEQELFDSIHRGVFWSGLSGVRIVHEVPVPSENPNWQSFSQLLNGWMLREFGYDFLGHLKDSCSLRVPTGLGDFSGLCSAMDALKNLVLCEVFSEPMDFSRPQPLLPADRACLLWEMETMITAAAWFKAIGYQRADVMESLLQLYRRGNFPLVIDTRDNKVHVYCSKT
jgi:hypothetical protein